MAIRKDTLDQLLAGRDPRDVFAKDGLVDELKKAFAVERNHINGIENFRNRAKRHLAGYSGIQKAIFTSSSKRANGGSISARPEAS